MTNAFTMNIQSTYMYKVKQIGIAKRNHTETAKHESIKTGSHGVG